MPVLLPMLLVLLLSASTGAPSIVLRGNNLQLNKLQATMERVRKVFGRIRPAEITSHNGVDERGFRRMGEERH